MQTTPNEEIAIFPGSIGGYVDFGDVVEIAIVNDSITHLKPSIPDLPCSGLEGFSVTQLPNGDVLLAGGVELSCFSVDMSDEYFHYRKFAFQ